MLLLAVLLWDNLEESGDGKRGEGGGGSAFHIQAALKLSLVTEWGGWVPPNLDTFREYLVEGQEISSYEYDYQRKLGSDNWELKEINLIGLSVAMSTGWYMFWMVHNCRNFCTEKFLWSYAVGCTGGNQITCTPNSPFRMMPLVLPSPCGYRCRLWLHPLWLHPPARTHITYGSCQLTHALHDRGRTMRSRLHQQGKFQDTRRYL